MADTNAMRARGTYIIVGFCHKVLKTFEVVSSFLMKGDEAFDPDL